MVGELTTDDTDRHGRMKERGENGAVDVPEGSREQTAKRGINA